MPYKLVYFCNQNSQFQKILSQKNKRNLNEAIQITKKSKNKSVILILMKIYKKKVNEGQGFEDQEQKRTDEEDETSC